jgi:hypothetical protein
MLGKKSLFARKREHLKAKEAIQSPDQLKEGHAGNVNNVEPSYGSSVLSENVTERNPIPHVQFLLPNITISGFPSVPAEYSKVDAHDDQLEIKKYKTNPAGYKI